MQRPSAWFSARNACCAYHARPLMGLPSGSAAAAAAATAAARASTPSPATARSIADCSALGVWMTKRGAWANLEAASLQAAIELENRTQIMVRGTGDLARAAAALTARKRPDPH